jgi:hypothetical protein
MAADGRYAYGLLVIVVAVRHIGSVSVQRKIVQHRRPIVDLRARCIQSEGETLARTEMYSMWALVVDEKLKRMYPCKDDGASEL